MKPLNLNSNWWLPWKFPHCWNFLMTCSVSGEYKVINGMTLKPFGFNNSWILIEMIFHWRSANIVEILWKCREAKTSNLLVIFLESIRVNLEFSELIWNFRSLQGNFRCLQGIYLEWMLNASIIPGISQRIACSIKLSSMSASMNSINCNFLRIRFWTKLSWISKLLVSPLLVPLWTYFQGTSSTHLKTFPLHRPP